jgi:hypothetical protein
VVPFLGDGRGWKGEVEGDNQSKVNVLTFFVSFSWILAESVVSL